MRLCGIAGNTVVQHCWRGPDGWVDGWCENSGGNSLGHGPKAVISRSPCQQRFLNSGFVDQGNLGSCVIELITRQLMAWGSQCVPTPRRYGSCTQDPLLTRNLRTFTGSGENHSFAETTELGLFWFLENFFN